MGKVMDQTLNTHKKSQDQIDEKDDKFVPKLDLPHDLITYSIIIRLPIKSLLQLKSISKQWYSTLSSSQFGNAHFKFSSFDSTIHDNLFIQCGSDYFIYSYDINVGDNDIVDVFAKIGLLEAHTGRYRATPSACYDIVEADCNDGLFKLDIDFDGLPKDKMFVIGSCNGLVCLYYSLLGFLIVWNPVTNQWVKISCPLLEGCKNFTWGFGYVSSVDDYKVVRISEMNSGRVKEIMVHVLSLRTGKWERVHDEKVQDYVLRGAALSAGVWIGECLYWIMYKRNGGYELDVLGFDLVLQRFDNVRGLVPGDSYLGWVRFLCTMGGCLSMSRFTNRGDVCVSILKGRGQVEYVGIYRDLNLGSCCAAVGFTRDGKFFIQLGEREIGLVDPNSSPKMYTPLVKFKGSGFIDIKWYAPSLMSPLALAEMQEE